MNSAIMNGSNLRTRQGERHYGLLRGACHPAALHAGCVARNNELAFSTATN